MKELGAFEEGRTEKEVSFRGKTMISAEEHSKVLESQTTFYSTAIETIRKELIAYNITVNNLAHAIKEQRVMI